MKRGGFKRPERPERSAPVASPITRRFGYGTPAVIRGTPKREYVRSEALRKAYRMIPCQGCGADDGTVCCAHSNWAEHGKGKSIKADDNRAASLCFRCHSWLDQGAGSGEEKRAFWGRAHRKSVMLLTERGLWPMGVAIPDIEAVE